MPAFPNVHIDGAAAKALVSAFLQQEEEKNRDLESKNDQTMIIFDNSKE